MTDVELALKKLRVEIESGKEAIKLAIENPLAASFADGLIRALEDPSARVLRLAQQQKKLGEQEISYELEREKERVQSVVREFEELHPPVLEPCPICLEDISIHSTAAVCSMSSCCGGWMCTDCSSKNLRCGHYFACPLCREAMPEQGNEELYNKRLLSCVERGVAWAQCLAGDKYESGEIGGRPDMNKALQHYILSAEQNHPPALLAIGQMYKVGVPGLIKKSVTKALEYELKAADLGDFQAMMNVALTHFQAELYGVKADYPTAVKYATLARHYATDNKIAATAAGVLGIFFQDGSGITSSVNLTAHYLGLAVRYDESSFEAGLLEQAYSACLLLQAENLYSGYHLAGVNVLPRALFWLEKSSNAGQSWAKNALKRMKAREAGKCSACNATEASSGKNFLRCGRCKLYCYCSKKCQRKSWNAGHKVDS